MRADLGLGGPDKLEVERVLAYGTKVCSKIFSCAHQPWTHLRGGQPVSAAFILTLCLPAQLLRSM